MNNRSIHGAFNARTLSTQELCKGFILSQAYNQLASPNNLIVVGPRGSGKTTLMRMLQVEALNIWEAEDADFYREEIDFSGVFIPTDRFWKSQFERAKTYVYRGGLDNEILKSTFNYHVLERFCSCLDYRVNGAIKSKKPFKQAFIGRAEESELVTQLASLWKVAPNIPSLRSLEFAVSEKKNEVSNYINKVISESDLGGPPIVIEGELVRILDASVRVVNSYFDEKSEKWAFLFDELELAPDELIQPLVDAMRGGPEDIILKLSLSPYHKNVDVTTNPDSSMGQNDLSIIRLSGLEEEVGLEFSEKLCAAVFKSNGFTNDIRSYFKDVKKMDVSSEFEELSKKDDSFSAYLNKNGIEIEKIPSYTEKNKNPTIRKIKFIAQIRNYYLKKQRKRPPDLYVGFDNLCKSMEFNPRMLISLMNILVSKAGKDKKIGIADQMAGLRHMYESHKALLNTIPLPQNSLGVRSIYDFVDMLGMRFRENMLGDTFQAEPKGTLTFRKVKDEGVLDIIGLALNSGALIVDTSDPIAKAGMVEIRDSRCRLSFLFSHKYSLLINKPRDIDLSVLFPVEERTSGKDTKPNIGGGLDRSKKVQPSVKSRPKKTRRSEGDDPQMELL